MEATNTQQAVAVQAAPSTPIQQISSLMNGAGVKAKFTEMLGKRAPQFISSVMTAINSNDLLQKSTPTSVYGAALMAATLDLPINQNLGFAYIVPFYNGKTRTNESQFQLGAKGYLQLAMRSGQYLKINVCEIYEGQIKVLNPVTEEYEFGTPTSNKVVGYMAYFKLLNGFEKYLYMTNEELSAHGMKYSQTFKKGFGLWKDNFDAMARKTVLKRLLSKYGILSVEMQKAQQFDQAVVNRSADNVSDIDDSEIVYVDNQPTDVTEHSNYGKFAEEEEPKAPQA